MLLSDPFRPTPSFLLITTASLLLVLTHTTTLSSGYNETVFEGKQEQAAKVKELLKSKGFISEELLGNEVAWFYT